MNYSKLIHDYLDSEITNFDEEMLFNELSKNNDLRTEFNSQLQLHLVAQNDIGTISTPIESTNLIFSTLGFNIPSNSNTVATVIASSFIKTHLKTILISLSTAFISGFIVYMMMQSNESNLIKSNENLALTEKISNNTSTPFVSSKSIDELDNTKKNYHQTNKSNDLSNQSFASINSNGKNDIINLNNKMSKKKSNKVVNNVINNSNFSDLNNIFKNGVLLSQSQFDDNFNSMKYSSFNTKNNSKNNNSNTSFRNESLSDFQRQSFDFSDFYSAVSEILPKDFNLQFNTLSNSSLNSLNIPSAGNSLLNNLALELSYNFNENNTLGFSIGQEQFSQQFLRNIENHQYEISQNPALFWYGLKYTLNLPELKLLNSIIPYSSVFAGGTISGPIVKFQLGANYFINSYISLNLSAEAGRLFYSVENSNYKSDKVGLSYGINLHY